MGRGFWKNRRNLGVFFIVIMIIGFLGFIAFNYYTYPVRETENTTESVPEPIPDNINTGSSLFMKTRFKYYTTMAYATIGGAKGIAIDGTKITQVSLSAEVSGTLQNIRPTTASFTVKFKVGSANYTIYTGDVNGQSTSPFFKLSTSFTDDYLMQKLNSLTRNTEYSLTIFVDVIARFEGVYSGNTYTVRLSGVAFTGKIVYWYESGTVDYGGGSSSGSSGGSSSPNPQPIGFTPYSIVGDVASILVLVVAILILFVVTGADGGKVGKAIREYTRRMKGKRLLGMLLIFSLFFSGYAMVGAHSVAIGHDISMRDVEIGYKRAFVSYLNGYLVVINDSSMRIIDVRGAVWRVYDYSFGGTYVVYPPTSNDQYIVAPLVASNYCKIMVFDTLHFRVSYHVVPNVYGDPLKVNENYVSDRPLHTILFSTSNYIIVPVFTKENNTYLHIYIVYINLSSGDVVRDHIKYNTSLPFGSYVLDVSNQKAYPADVISVIGIYENDSMGVFGVVIYDRIILVAFDFSPTAFNWAVNQIGALTTSGYRGTYGDVSVVSTGSSLSDRYIVYPVDTNLYYVKLTSIDFSAHTVGKTSNTLIFSDSSLRYSDFVYAHGLSRIYWEKDGDMYLYDGTVRKKYDNQYYGAGHYTRKAQIGDFDDDGIGDYAYFTGSKNEFVIYTSRDDSVSTIPYALKSSVSFTGYNFILADIDMDGKLEIVFVDYGYLVVIDTEFGSYGSSIPSLTSFGVRYDTLANMDFDHDGLTNKQEIQFGSSPYLFDTDQDGLSDFQEYVHHTDPQNPDTDGDGFTDSWEIANGLDPLVPNYPGGESSHNGGPSQDGNVSFSALDGGDMLPVFVFVVSFVVVFVSLSARDRIRGKRGGRKK